VLIEEVDKLLEVVNVQVSGLTHSLALFTAAIPHKHVSAASSIVRITGL
jgi:hypothetical protein